MLIDVYKQFLKLYPEKYQKKYRRQMLQTMRDIMDNEDSPAKRRFVLVREIIATPLNAAEQYLVIFAQHRHIAPKTVVSLVALALLAPFVIALIADEVSEFAIGTHLYNTWLWSRTALLIWIFILPLVSLAVSLSVYIISLIRQYKREKHVAWLGKRYWLTIITVLFSASVLFLVVFHDSVHCWLGTTHINNVLNCTEAGILGGDSH